MRVLLLVPIAVLSAATLLKVVKPERDGATENEIRSKDAKTPAITYVCAAVFVPLGDLQPRVSFSS